SELLSKVTRGGRRAGGTRNLCRLQAQMEAKRGGSLSAPSRRKVISCIRVGLTVVRLEPSDTRNRSSTTLSARVNTSASTILRCTALNAAAALANKPCLSQVQSMTRMQLDSGAGRQLTNGAVAGVFGIVRAFRNP